MKHNSLPKILICLATAMLVLSAHAVKLEECITQIIPQETITSLSLNNTNGSITCLGWDKPEIQITYIKKVKASNEENAQQYLDNIEVEIVKNNETLTIKTKHPNTKGISIWKWFKGNKHSGSVNYELKIPKSLVLKLDSVNGSVTVTSMSGKLNASTVNGGLRCEDLSASAIMKTVNGSIKCAFSKNLKTEDMSFKTVNGSVKVYVPETIECSIKVSTVNGSIKTDFPRPETGKKKRKSLKCDINGGGPLLRFSTVNGSVSILKTI